jgi:hypothetical protein
VGDLFDTRIGMKKNSVDSARLARSDVAMTPHGYLRPRSARPLASIQNGRSGTTYDMPLLMTSMRAPVKQRRLDGGWLSLTLAAGGVWPLYISTPDLILRR